MDVGVAGFEMKEQLEMTPQVFDLKIKSAQPIFKSSLGHSQALNQLTSIGRATSINLILSGSSATHVY